MDALYILSLVAAATAGVMIDRWLLCPVTHCDLEAAKDEIIKAMGSNTDPAVKQATSDLKASADSLKDAVENN